MQTQKIHDDFYFDEVEDRGPVVAHLTMRAENITYDLYRGSNQIGRGNQNDVVIDHATVSDVHAEIDIKDNNDAVVKDLRSSNGTFVEAEPFSNDFVQLLKGQTQVLREGCIARFGFMHLTFSLAVSNNGNEEEGNDNGGQFDVDSDDEQEGNVEINLDLQGVLGVNNAASGIDDPTQEVLEEPAPRLHPPLAAAPRGGAKKSIFDQATQRPDDGLDVTLDDEEEEEEEEDTFRQEGVEKRSDVRGSDADRDEEDDEDAVYNMETAPYPSIRQVLGRDDDDDADAEVDTFVADQPQPDLSRNSSAASSVESPTQIVPDYEEQGGGSETEADTEGEEEEVVANVTLTSDDGVQGGGGTLLDPPGILNLPPVTATATATAHDIEDNSDAESEDILMNSQAELDSDALHLILPPELSEAVAQAEDTVNRAPSEQKKAQKQQEEQEQEQENDQEPYMTQVSPSKRVDIRAVESVALSGGSPALAALGGSGRSMRGHVSIAEQLAAAEDATEDTDEEPALGVGAALLPKLLPPMAAKKRAKRGRASLFESEDEDEGEDDEEEDRTAKEEKVAVTAAVPAKKRERAVKASPKPASSAKELQPELAPEEVVVEVDQAVPGPVPEVEEGPVVTAPNAKKGGKVDKRKKGTKQQEREEEREEAVLLLEAPEPPEAEPEQVPAKNRGKAVKAKAAPKSVPEVVTLVPEPPPPHNQQQHPEVVVEPPAHARGTKRKVKQKVDDQEPEQEQEQEQTGEDEQHERRDEDELESPPKPAKKRGRVVKAVPVPEEPLPEPEPEPEPEAVSKGTKRKGKATTKVAKPQREEEDEEKHVQEQESAEEDVGVASKRGKTSSRKPSVLPSLLSARAGGRHVAAEEEEDDEGQGVEGGAAAKPLRVLFTGVEPDDKMKAMVKKIGGTIVDLADMEGVTHVITDEVLKRTPKMLVALNSGACYVVSMKWLEDSAQQGAPVHIALASSGATPSSSSSSSSGSTPKKGRGRLAGDYLIQDREREDKWAPFTLLDTLSRNYHRMHTAKAAAAAAASAGGAAGGVFEGLGVFVASDVFGRGAPSREEMQLIVESGGGAFLTTAGEVSKFEKQGGGAAVVIVHKDSKKVPAKAIASFAKKSLRPGRTEEGSQGLYSVEFLFSAVMRQELDYSKGLIPHLSL